MAGDSILNGEQINFLKENFSEEFNHIYRELKNINVYVEERIYKNVQKDMNLETAEKNLDEAEKLLKVLGEVKSLNESIKNTMEIALRFKKDINELEEEIQFNDEKREYSKRNIPQYDRVKSDTNIPHSINEDFTYKKPCGFMFRGKVYEAYSMRDILIKICEILYKENPKKLRKFVNDPNMKGRKLSYFRYDEVIEDGIPRNKIIPGSNIYVWVNLSNNSIIELIKKILFKFCISKKEISIYLSSEPDYLEENLIVNTLKEDRKDIKLEEIKYKNKLYDYNESEYLGEKVFHQNFGIGKIEEIKSKRVKVKFEREEKTFEFPEAFKNGFLGLIN